jgi:hypothetical protein
MFPFFDVPLMSLLLPQKPSNSPTLKSGVKGNLLSIYFQKSLYNTVYHAYIGCIDVT